VQITIFFNGVSQAGAEYWLYSTLADFLSNKSVPASWKEGFYTCRLPNYEDIGGIFVFVLSASEL
jgi:hypothetical protein